MVSTKLPQRIERLYELANNLWWSWHPEARNLFRSLDYPLWRLNAHNPVKQLPNVSPRKLQVAAEDPAFLAQYDAVVAAFDADMSATDTWIATHHPALLRRPVAFFSMEFALHTSLPIYAGGLGVLAGDLCKEASDLGLPLVGVGFMYPEGYFQQRVSPEGWQEEIIQMIDFSTAPIRQVYTPDGDVRLAQVQMGDITVSIGAWLVQLGRSRIYLLDTNIEDNPRAYRQLSARLYVADPEIRLQQEIVLGMGGVRVLAKLGIEPAIWHANEGHTAFMMIERVREAVAGGRSMDEAMKLVQATSVFTTHTPVQAGHDVFSAPLVDRYLAKCWKSLGISREKFLQLGAENPSDGRFNMTALSLRLARYRNAVSQLHGKVARRMWHNLWSEVPVEEVPIAQVTNGVHIPTWVAPEIARIFEEYIGKDWLREQDKVEVWDKVFDIPDSDIWDVRQLLKRKLKGVILERTREHYVTGKITPGQMLATGSLLDPDVLTIAFVRRFTEYKRPMLIFRDMERLKHIITNPLRPVQIIFAGKSHPADLASKNLLHQVYVVAQNRELDGRIGFVEDYSMHLAHYLVQGVDVWLNTPRRCQEASGTSGMKAAVNGVLHLSVPDGWWYEGYNGINGWKIGDAECGLDKEDSADAEALYRLLEDEIIPLYYDRDRRGVPHGWTQIIKESIRSVLPAFSARRMLKDYTEQMYLPASGQ